MERYVRFILGHRGLVLLVALALSALSAASVSRAVIASSLVKLFFSNNPKYDAYRKLAETFGGNDIILLVYEDPALLSAEGMARVRRIERAIAAVPDVWRVDSLAGAQRMRGAEDALVIEPWADLFARTSSAAGVASLARELLRDGLIAGLLIGRDGKSTAIAVELTVDADRPVEELPRIQAEVLACVLREGVAREHVHLAGMLPETVEVTSQTRIVLAKVFPFMVLVLIGIVYLLFFRLWPVALTISITLLSVLWTFGFAVQLDRHINILMAMVPGIMMIVGFSDVIHMYNAYVGEVVAGRDRHEALVASCAEVGTASAFTALTEFVGFVSLAFVPTEIMRLAGVVLGFGVGATLLAVITLVPVILSLMPDAALLPKRAVVRDRAGPVLDAIVRGTLRLAMRRPLRVVLAFGLLTAVALAGVFRLNVDTDFAARLPRSNHIQRAREFIQERFSAAQFLDLYVTGDLLDPAVLARVASYQAELGKLDGVDRTLSVIDVFRRVHEEVSGSADDPFRSGAMTRELAAQYLLLFEVSGGSGLERVIDEPRRRLKISVRTTRTALREVYGVGLDAEALAAKHFAGMPVQVEAQGVNFLLGDWIRFIVEGQRDGLAFSVLTTLVMMMFVLRSARGGAMAMVPNFLPLLYLGGWLGFTRDKVDSDTLIVASIAMGIAVDDTIHFLTRFRHEIEKDHDVEKALIRTSTSTGRAILQAAAVLCAGFAPFALSDYYSLHMMGTLLPMTLAVALVCELLLTPALVVLGLGGWR